MLIAQLEYLVGFDRSSFVVETNKCCCTPFLSRSCFQTPTAGNSLALIVFQAILLLASRNWIILSSFFLNNNRDTKSSRQQISRILFGRYMCPLSWVGERLNLAHATRHKWLEFPTPATDPVQRIILSDQNNHSCLGMFRTFPIVSAT